MDKRLGNGFIPDGELDPPDPVEYEDEDEEEDEDEGEENNHYERYGYKLWLL